MPLHDRWVLRSDSDDHRAIGFASPLLRAIAYARGVHDAPAFRQFTAPTLEDLHDASLIHGMGEACDRIERAMRDRERILIYGDYDVDGVTSIVLLQTVLRSLGARVSYVVPHRLFDGYGLKIEVLDRVLVDESVGLVVTVDCGITSVEPVQRALDRGIDVIITDHHLPPGVLPEAAAVLNPKQPGCAYPFKDLAGVGVAFKLCSELLRRNGGRIAIGSLLKIAAIGTIADVAPLIDENRWIAKIGLYGLGDVRNPGLRALLRVAGINGKTRASDVGFRIGPRINAAGRLASADTAIRLFEAGSDEEAYPLALELEKLNRERQRVEKEVLAAAEAMVDAAALESRVLVLASEEWHKGVLGLCAARIAQAHTRPTLMMSIDGESCIGSARSVGTVDLHAALASCADLFERFGGHAYACGFSLERSRIDELRRRLARHFDGLDALLFSKTVEMEGEISIREADAAFLAEHDELEPFGAGNRQPLFLLRNVTPKMRREFSTDCHAIDLSDASGQQLSAVLWPRQRELAGMMRGNLGLDLVAQFESDRYAKGGVRAVIVDAVPSGDAPLVRNESRPDSVTE
jgi:single-stranded-DNA-specific exonuclease